jgi:hypothetical protein
LSAPATSLPPARLSGLFPFLKRYPLVVIAGLILGLIVLAAVFAPFMFTRDPTSMYGNVSEIDSSSRIKASH